MSISQSIAQRRQEGVTYFGIPSGSLQEHTIALLISAGLLKEDPKRKYEAISQLDGVTFRILDRIDMGRLVLLGVVDAGITGKDYLRETGMHDQVVPIADFIYSKKTRQPSRLVLAAEPAVCENVDQCRGAAIATELPNLTREMLMEKCGFSATDTDGIFKSHGKTESNGKFGAAQAFTDITETGDTLRENGLKELVTLFESNPQLVMNRESKQNPAVVARIEEIATRFNAALLREVEPTTMLSLNVEHGAKQAAVLLLLPSSKAPDIIPTNDPKTVAITTQVPRQGVEALMYKLLLAGADDLFDAESGITLSQNMRISIR